MSDKPLIPAELQPHQQRVLAEYRELAVKIEKLHAFLMSDQYEFLSLHNFEHVLLMRQLSAMEVYLNALGQRLEFWGAKV